MFKITMGQASSFNSPVIASLFSDGNKKFPISDGFKLLDFMDQARSKMKRYQEEVRSVIDKNSGDVAETGQVTYPSIELQESAIKEIGELNETEIELTGDKVVPSLEWPKLSLAEMTVLKPLINLE